jgi:hypothetical protein
MLMGTETIKEAEALKLWSAVASAVTVTVEPTMVEIWSGLGTTNVRLPPTAE